MLSKLADVFSPSVVSELSDDVVDSLIGVTDSQREDLVRDLDTLQTARAELEHLVRDGLPKDLRTYTLPMFTRSRYSKLKH